MATIPWLVHLGEAAMSDSVRKSLVSNKLWVLMGVLCIATCVQAQERNRRGFGGLGGPGGFGAFGRMGGDILSVLEYPEVKQAIGLTEQQEAYVTLLRDDQRESGREFFGQMRDMSPEQARDAFRAREAEVEKQLTDIVGEDKVKRLKQIRLQIQGAFAMFNPEVSDQLGISDEQRDKIREANEAVMEEVQAIIRKKQQEKLESILTDSQKAKWKEMTGDSVEIKSAPPRRDRGARRGGPAEPGDRPQRPAGGSGG